MVTEQKKNAIPETVRQVDHGGSLHQMRLWGKKGDNSYAKILPQDDF